MSMNVNVSTYQEYLLATVTGTFNMEEAGAYIKDVISDCYKFSKRKVIVDFSQLEGEIFAIQRALVGMSIAEISSQNKKYRDEPLKIAFVAGQDYLSDNAPGADHMRKSGIEVLITSEIDAAIKWI